MTEPIAVVGGGIVGSAIARRLQRHRANVVLIERDQKPRGASYYSFASLSAFDEPATELYALKSLGMSDWRRWARESGGVIGLRWAGEVRWAESDDGGRLLTGLLERALRRGYSVEEISSKQLAKSVPGCRPDDVKVATYAPHDGQVDTAPALDWLRKDFSAAGGTVLTGRANLRFDDSGVFVRAGTEEFRARKVVIAAGAETHSLLDQLGWSVPVESSPGLIVATEPVAQSVTGTVYIYPRSGPPVHFRQTAKGRLLIGEGSQDQQAREQTNAYGEELLAQVQRALPHFSDARVKRVTVENRPIPEDRLPIVGPMPGMPSLYLATTHAGVTLAPILAKMVTQEILEDRPALHLERCRPGRFQRHHAELAADVDSAFALPSEVYLG